MPSEAAVEASCLNCGLACGLAQRTELQIHVIAVDIGASGLRAATASLDGEVMERTEAALELDATTAELRASLQRLLCVWLGSGVNAALAVGGRSVDLADGALGDAGHVVVDPEGPACPTPRSSAPPRR